MELTIYACMLAGIWQTRRPQGTVFCLYSDKQSVSGQFYVGCQANTAEAAGKIPPLFECKRLSIAKG
jgi:hypothetical protein